MDRPERNHCTKCPTAVVRRSGIDGVEADPAPVASNGDSLRVQHLERIRPSRVAVWPFDAVFHVVRHEPDAAGRSMEHALRRIDELCVNAVLAGTAPRRQGYQFRTSGNCRSEGEQRKQTCEPEQPQTIFETTAVAIVRGPSCAVRAVPIPTVVQDSGTRG
jgi:hypothetical protein